MFKDFSARAAWSGCKIREPRTWSELNSSKILEMSAGTCFGSPPGMSRRHRINICGGIYHFMSRGNRKGLIFVDDRDRRQFVRILVESLERYSVLCNSGCLMGNHYHCIVVTPRGNLSAFMKHLNQLFTQYMNWRHGWTGHVFEGRPTALLIETGYYLRNALAYVARNPVEARLVIDPAEWRWSSYAATIGRAPAPDWLNLDWLDSLFPDASRRQSQEQFRAFVTGSSVASTDLYTGAPAIGSPEFRRLVREHIGATLYKAGLPRSYRALARPPLDELFEIVMDKAHRARLIQRAHVVHGYKLAEIAAHLSLHPNSISRILSELRRDGARRIRARA